MEQWPSQVLHDPSAHRRGQVKSNTLTCTSCNNSCVPIRLQERCEIFILLGPQTAADQSMNQRVFYTTTEALLADVCCRTVPLPGSGSQSWQHAFTPACPYDLLRQGVMWHHYRWSLVFCEVLYL